MRDRIDGHASTGRDRLRELDPAHLWIIGMTRPRDTARGAGFGRPPRGGASAALFRAPGPSARALTGSEDIRETAAAGMAAGSTLVCECPDDCLIDHELD